LYYLIDSTILNENSPMKLFLILLLVSGLQEDVPFKPSDEFEVNVDLTFKIKNSQYSPNTFSGSGERLDKPSSTTLPFLTVVVKHLKIQSDEVKVEALNSKDKTLFKKKVSSKLELRFEMGFVDDLKSNTSASTITLYFLSSEKKQLRKIVFSVSASGVFTVNGNWHGQF
jgi:hypothetical protein